MIINHNMNALNAHRNMTTNTAQSGKSMEKLSSGLRINRAGDDAAGLAISEKMRGQIRGLDQASRNAQDGISLIQTAEGALNETHSILQRMRELAVQSSNDTNNADDRAEIQKEVDQLSQEITRISDNTQFNEKNLLDGSFDGTFHIGANSGQDINLEIDGMGAADLKVEGFETKLEAGKIILTNRDSEIEYTIDVTAGTAATSTTAGSEFGVSVSGTTISVQLGSTWEDGAAVGTSLDDVIKEINDKGIEGVTASLKEGADGSATATTTDGDGTLAKGEANSELGVNVSTQKSASEAITTINTAIKTVSAQRSNLGSVQNRLEHTNNNLQNTSENLTAAESRVRDVDMAKEMMTFSKNNILSQAAQAMMSQANQQPQGVLQLLR